MLGGPTGHVGHHLLQPAPELPFPLNIHHTTNPHTHLLVLRFRIVDQLFIGQEELRPWCNWSPPFASTRKDLLTHSQEQSSVI